MRLSDQQLNSFIQLYQSKYGVVLDPQIAHGKAVSLLRLITVVESQRGIINKQHETNLPKA